MALDKATQSTVLSSVAGALVNDSIRAVLLFGSRAGGAYDAHSDYDLLVVTRHSNLRRTLMKEGLLLDVIYATENKFLNRLIANRPDNNNFFLEAFATSDCIKDNDGIGVTVRQRARLLWEQGPEKMTRRERLSSARSLEKMLRTVSDRALRCQNLPEDQTLLQMRLDEIFVRCIYLTFRFHREWTTNLSLLMRTKLFKYPDMERLWYVYSRCKSQEEKLETTRATVKLVSEQLMQNAKKRAFD